ncbi:unnamed protein product [Rhizoctonia solani]|uniref:Thioesterase domain-containing protein n=1 Tax=Rhizoctonia solani TaxID=456999 RepID=A0A8H3GRU3_9AGAM|nr:unnamed protein product [Rhizoctonia solani]
MELRQVLIRYVTTWLVDFIVRKLKTRSNSIVQRRVESHFDKRLFSVQIRLELGPSESPANESKIRRVTGYSSEAWSSLTTIIDMLSTIGEVIATATVLKGEIISSEGVNFFGMWALCFPLLTELNEHRGEKVFYAKITNQNWLRKEAFSQLGTWKHYKKEILSSGLEDYISSEYTRATSGVGDLNTESPVYSSLFESWFDLSDFDQLLDALPLLLCTWSAVHNSPASSLATMIRTQQTSGAACGVIWNLIYRGKDLFKLFGNLKALYEVLEMKPGIEGGHINYPDEEHADQKGMAIEFKNVSFGYPFTPDKILNDLSFKIEPDPDIEIENAAKLGGAYDFVRKLPLGFDTNLDLANPGCTSLACGESEKEMFKSIQETEKSIQFSGGQWQRLAISRTFMRNSKKTRLLCYDEPSASLDPKAEAETFERLRNLRGDKTIIFVTQSRGAAVALLAISVGSASYVAGSLYPPTTLQLINPPPAPPAPALGTEEANIYLTALEGKLQNLPLTRELRQRQGWYESRPYQNYPEERRRHSLTSGTLRGPGKLAIPPLVFAKDDESEAIAIIHVGRSLCGHDGIVHGGLLATLLDETLARNALLNLPAKVGVTANLSVNYRAPARADQFITIHTHLDKVSGRKVTVSGTVTSLETGEILTEATALFVQPKYAHLLNAHGEVEKVLGSRNVTSQEVGPDGAKKQVKVPQEAAV